MTSNRKTCIFVGSGFSCTLFNQKIQKDFIESFVVSDSVSIKIKNYIDELRAINDIELFMSNYYNLAHSALKDEENYGWKIVTIRSAISIYYRNNIKNELDVLGKCYSKLHSKLKLFNCFINDIKKDNVFFVTTNYDLCIEELLKNIESECSYYYPQHSIFKEQRIKNDGIPIFKLHGSINWLEQRAPNNRGKLKFNDPLEIEDTELLHDVTLEKNPMKGYKEEYLLCKKDDNKYFSPILIPFFFQKESWLSDRWHNLFDSIWNTAREFMTKADKYYFIGYSLPAADHYIYSYLYKIFKNKKPCEITVIDKTNDTILIKLFDKILKNEPTKYKKGLINYLKKNEKKSLSI